MNDISNIGPNIKKLRETAEIDADTMAAFMGIQTNTLNDYETGTNTHMKVCAIKTVEDLFQTTLEELSQNTPSEASINTAEAIAGVGRLDDKLLNALADIGRIANNIKEMRKLNNNA